jgi:protein O-mannosyl-transferase
MKAFVSKWAAWLVAGVTLLIYLPAVFNNFVEWDDSLIITNNPRFISPSWETVGYYWTHRVFNLYMPITCTLWAALAKLGMVGTPDAMGTRLNPYLFHFAQVVLHVIATMAVFAILKRALGSAWPAMAAALFFAIHPLQVESVAFIGAMNGPLAASMMLTAIWIYWGCEKKWRWAATVLFVASLLAKPTAVVAPAILILLDLAVDKRTLRQAIASALPWIILAIPCLVWTKMNQGAPSGAQIQPIWTRFLIAGDAMAFYVRKLFLPWPLGIDYGRTPSGVASSMTIWWAWLVPAAILSAAWFGRRRWGVAAAGIAIFFVAMLPNSGLVPFEYQYVSTTADRYAYLSMLGAAMVLGSWLQSGRPIRVTVSAIVLGICLVLTEAQIGVWRDGETLFRHAILVNPQGWMPRTNLGLVLANRSPDEAIFQSRKAVELSPQNWIARDNLSALLFARDPDQAIAQCRAALQLNPQDANAYNNLGTALIYKGDRDGALAAFTTAYRLAPEDRNIASNYHHASAENSSTTKHAE